MIHHFTVYDKATGAILRAGRCSNAADVLLQARGDNEAVTDQDGHGLDESHVVHPVTKLLVPAPVEDVLRRTQEKQRHAEAVAERAPLLAELQEKFAASMSRTDAAGAAQKE